MIPNQWYVVLEAHEVPRDRPLSVTRFGVPLALWRQSHGAIACVHARCPHRGASLAAGEVRPNVPFHLEFVFPNLWQNHINDNMRIVAAFVPVDDETSVLYLRHYQRLPLPRTVGRIACRLAMPANRVIARQDRRVVETQLPKQPTLRGGDKLVQADGPIVAYRRRREALQALAGAGCDAATENRAADEPRDRGDLP